MKRRGLQRLLYQFTVILGVLIRGIIGLMILVAAVIATILSYVICMPLFIYLAAKRLLSKL